MRYDVKITMTQEHSLVVEAPDPAAAQAQALEHMPNRPAERLTMEVSIEVGVQ